MAKVITLEKDESIRQLRKKLQRAQKGLKSINAKYYTDTLSLAEDPLAFQKRMRNEWN